MTRDKQLKNQITEYIVWGIKKINFLNLSDKNIGFLIRAFHFNLPFYLFLCILYASKVQCIIILFWLCVALILFIFFNGCILSKIENAFDGEDLTIVDPILDICNLERSNKNRTFVSFLIAFFYLSTFLFIFRYRFGFSIEYNDFTVELTNNIKMANNIYLYFTSLFTAPFASKTDNLKCKLNSTQAIIRDELYI